MRVLDITPLRTPDAKRLVQWPAPLAGAGAGCIPVGARGVNRLHGLQRVLAVGHAQMPAATAQAHAVVQGTAHIGKRVVNWESA